MEWLIAMQEYDVAREYDLSTAEGIAKQKQLVNKRLGLGSEVFDGLQPATPYLPNSVTNMSSGSD
jgi:hypothetical protein